MVCDKPTPEPTPEPEPSCQDAKTTKDCTRPCYWCENAYAPTAGTCVDESAAKYMPASVFSCKEGKKVWNVAIIVSFF